MLRRQRLETRFDELDRRCNEADKALPHDERIRLQQKLVVTLERKLSEAKDALRLLKAEAP